MIRLFIKFIPVLLALSNLLMPFSDVQIVGAMAFWMITWWIFEIMPLGITALIPSILLPLSGILSLKSTLSFYSHPIIYLFLGGFIIAQALEKTQLSERFAMIILKYTGKSAKGVLIGFMISTAFLSMWISNTATTVMMIPIADSILKFIQKYTENSSKHLRLFSICLMLSIAYAANIGGTMTPIGTPPNVVFMGYLQELLQIEVDFYKWMLIVSPISISLLIITYFVNAYLLYPFKLELDSNFHNFLSNKLKSLGNLSKEQKITLVIFALTCLSWIFKNPINSILEQKLIQDPIIALAGGVSLFFFSILDEKDISHLPWNIVLLFGGGMALANSFAHVGLLESVSELFQSYGTGDLYFFVFISSALILFLTEVMSNVALCTIALPVFITFAQKEGIDPMIIGVPLTLCSSFAFSMPISTPPNAIVFATGKISVKHMMRAGILMNIASILMTMSIGWFMLKNFL